MFQFKHKPLLRFSAHPSVTFEFCGNTAAVLPVFFHVTRLQLPTRGIDSQILGILYKPVSNWVGGLNQIQVQRLRNKHH